MIARPVLGQVVLSIDEARLVLALIRQPLPIDVAHGRDRRPSELADLLEQAIGHVERYPAAVRGTVVVREASS